MTVVDCGNPLTGDVETQYRLAVGRGNVSTTSSRGLACEVFLDVNRAACISWVVPPHFSSGLRTCPVYFCLLAGRHHGVAQYTSGLSFLLHTVTSPDRYSCCSCVHVSIYMTLYIVLFLKAAN